MKKRAPFTYSILRYGHDLRSGEFLNIGVVLHCPERKYIGGRFGAPNSRLKALFPNIDPWVVQHALETVTARFVGFQKTLTQDQASQSREVTALTFCHQALPPDDGSLVWAPLGSGISVDPEATLGDLYGRFIGHAASAGAVRADDDVWSVFRDQFQRNHAAGSLHEVCIESVTHRLKFPCGWRNDRLQCYLPLSLDLASEGEIFQKAYEALGRLSSVRQSTTDAHVYLLIGEPRRQELVSAAREAAELIRANAPMSCSVVKEADAGTFADSQAVEMRLAGRRRA